MIKPPKPLPCPCLPLAPCYYDWKLTWFKGIALELDDASVLANSVTVTGTGLVVIIASKLKISYEGKVQALNSVCVNGRRYSTSNYSLEDFKQEKETPKWQLVGACGFPYAKVIVAE